MANGCLHWGAHRLGLSPSIIEDIVRHLLFVLIVCLFTAVPSPAAAVTVRYAMVIGNNTGVDADGQQPFSKLQFAQREAQRLRDQLVALANFDRSPERTILLTGGTRAQVYEAAQALAKQKLADLQTFGKIETLFAFFFTGHGLNGRLLLADGPLTGADLGEIFRSVGADLNVSVFDACYSGSLEPGAMSTKGIEMTPGLNIFRALPEQVLTAEGSVWFVSSAADQVSYEDENLGGVFTHFFIEALAKAQRDGPGITLERVWHYAREKTVEHTARRGRRQEPQQFVTNLKETGPFYFSFPGRRTARLILGEAVGGRFLLSYADGQLTERLVKKPGVRREMLVYPGTAHLLLLEEGKILLREELTFVDGGEVALSSTADVEIHTSLGERIESIWVKGASAQTLHASRTAAGASVSVGASYRYSLPHPGLLSPSHQTGATLRLDYDWLLASLFVGYGRAAEQFDSWSYEADAFVLAAQLGLAKNLSMMRLSGSLSVGASAYWQRYDNGRQRQSWAFEPAVVASVLLPNDGLLGVELSASTGPTLLPGVGRSAGYHWAMNLDIAAALIVRVW